MRRRLLWILICLLAAPVSFAADPAPTATPDEVLANRALANKISLQAQLSLGSGAITTANLRHSAAMLEMATKLDPTEPRHLRLLTEAYLQVGGDEGRDGALGSLSRYLKIEPTDLGSQLRLIRLHFARIEAADKQREYIEDLLGKKVLAAELRAEIAVLGAKLSLDRVEVEQSKKYIDQALQLSPLCPEALRLKYESLDESTPPDVRLGVLLNMLRSNPAQSAVMADIADTLASGGMVDAAQTWYVQMFKLANRMGANPDPSHVTQYAAELVIADQHSAAAPYIKQLIEMDPTNSDAAFLDLLTARRSKEPERIDSAVATVQKSLETRLSRVADVLHDRQEPGTFDIAADVKKLQDAARIDLTSTYAAALADLAWIKIHFLNKPTDAQKYIDPLRQLLAADSVTLARLEGWAFLVDGKKDEARVKLSAVAPRDALSALGLIRLDSADQPAEKVLAEAKKLVTDNASGLMGAMLIESLRDKVGIMPMGPNAAVLKAELDKFNMRWLDFLDLGEAKDFYVLKADPVQVAHKFGEPILAKITITNSGPFDITIGPDGAIKPDLWMDLRLNRPEQRNLPGVAFDRMTARLVLHANETVSQIVRVDAGPVVGILASNPMLEMGLIYSVLTNPMTVQGVVPGPGGYRVQFQRPPVRSASPLTANVLMNLTQLLMNAPGDAKVRALDLLGTYSLLLRSMNDPSAKSKGTEFADIVRKSTVDPVPGVRAQAMLVTAFLSDADVRRGVVQQMLSDSSVSVRGMGLTSLTTLPDWRQYKEMVKPLTEDKDPQVKALAAAVLEVAELPPTTQPTGPGEAVAPGTDTPATPILPVPGGSVPPPPSDPKPAENPAPGGRGLRL